MKKTLNNLSEIVAKANDTFFERHNTVDTLMGIMDKTLRNQGMDADAITIDCLTKNTKIVLVLHASKPDEVDIALGNKEGKIYTSNVHVLADIDSAKILKIMEENFLD